MVKERKDVKHLDTAESVFFKRQLEVIKSRTYDVKYKDLKAFSLIPISAEAPSGATEITWRQFKQYGLAKIIADYAHDFPRVDVFGTEQTIKIKDLGDAYGWTIKEIRRAAITGFNLEQRRSNAARRAMDEKINTIAFLGDTTYKINGLLKYPGITEYTVPLGAALSKTWASKTADEILTDLNGIKTAITVPTVGKEKPTKILMPMTQLDLIKNKRLGTVSDKTVYQFFKENNPDIELDELEELVGIGDDDDDRFFAYSQDEGHVTLEIPVAFEQLEEEHRGMEYVIPCHAECAGCIVYYPLAFAYGDGI